MKLVSIFDSPAPYTTPVLNALADRIEVHAIYLAPENRVSRFADSWGVEPTFEHSIYWARPLNVPSIDLHVEFSIGVARRLGRLKPDAILLVSWKPTGLEPLIWSRFAGSAAVMWAESTSFSGLLREPVSTRIRRYMTHACDGYVSNGSQATTYLKELGVPSERIVTSMLPAGRTPQTTERTRTDDEIRFLFVGRLLAQKRPLELIAAFASVREAVPNATLTVVGAGELEGKVSVAAGQVPGVRYVGRREGDDLASYYCESDILVLPARREVWGIVVNEALSHGLFVIATDQVGSAYDLLDDETGLVLAADNLAQLAASMIQAARTVDRSDIARRRRASTISVCTPERFAADIARATDIALRVRAGRWRGRREPTRG